MGHGAAKQPDDKVGVDARYRRLSGYGIMWLVFQLLVLAEQAMQKVVRKFRSFVEEEEAMYEQYRMLSGNEKLQLLLDLIMPENPDEAVIERHARVHPLAEHEEC
jgi:Na+-transporting methylmalonyl-CoA/oxaloacetate decarboxylase gamma subunit